MMDCVIFCGGYGTRMNNGEPGVLKPLIEVGGKEILRHIISIYEAGGVSRFILLGGYRIKDLNAFARKYPELSIEVADTGEGTPTAGRLLLAKRLIRSESFFLTYGDSLTNFHVADCLAFRTQAKADFTVSIYRKLLEYGIMQTTEDMMLETIQEKTFSVKINAGFYILTQKVFDYIQSENQSFETDVLPAILRDKKIRIGCHEVSFWHPMDTPQDREKLNRLLENNPAVFLN